MKNVSVGDKFKLGPWMWEVADVLNTYFLCFRIDYKNCSFFMDMPDADKLDWIKPEVTFTREQAEAIKKQVGNILRVDEFFDWLDDNTEK